MGSEEFDRTGLFVKLHHSEDGFIDNHSITIVADDASAEVNWKRDGEGVWPQLRLSNDTTKADIPLASSYSDFISFLIGQHRGESSDPRSWPESRMDAQGNVEFCLDTLEKKGLNRKHLDIEIVDGLPLSDIVEALVAAERELE
jgi:hypothetical protein